MCVNNREGMPQEGKQNLHGYKERERDMYAIVEARVCGCINLSRGYSINVCERNTSRGAKARVLCVREREVSREGEWKEELCVCICVRDRERRR